ncbi:WecB/TagA/CpsF family glycosyl transferase [Treponema paraluiscuniculi Cuniculi A]|uniref:WecB/TagA/CpsF family glycosyl transferase n=3 Tax=Treponema TaxID=157 RepID=F7XS98_TREPU|nr:WecB/TagA/CpsF family glycosyltransferase [Treponema paraluiscuniculi]AEH40226.1 WecB/TagA/CpsF family glycosyl transferase [Treponema paraluiscuniculi Cuniculi A]WKC72160.1 WecB/TagA/CpsF family glycosyl transferase [Treponema paraluiscuniculi]
MEQTQLVTRIEFLSVPLDVVREEYLCTVILSLLEKKEPQHIIFLSLWDVLKARHNHEFRTMVDRAALCLPTSYSIVRGARFLGLPTPIFRHPFQFIITLLNVMDTHYKSLYLFGGRGQSLLEAERNVHSTFPGLSVVGRFHGFYRKTLENNIITAIVKSNASLVIVGNGVPGGVRWIARNRAHFAGGIFVQDSEVIDIFSKRRKRPRAKELLHGRSPWGQTLHPLRWHRSVRYVWYIFLLLFYRIFRTK